VIEKVQSYKVGEKFFNTFEQAQEAEIMDFFSFVTNDQIATMEHGPSRALALHVMDNKAKLMDILTSTPRSRAKARAINGAKRKRKSLPKTITASETGA